MSTQYRNCSLCSFEIFIIPWFYLNLKKENEIKKNITSASWNDNNYAQLRRCWRPWGNNLSDQSSISLQLCHVRGDKSSFEFCRQQQRLLSASGDWIVYPHTCDILFFLLLVTKILRFFSPHASDFLAGDKNRTRWRQKSHSLAAKIAVAGDNNR